MNQKTMRRLVWLAVLSYVAPPVISADECDVASSVVGGVCASGGVLTGVAGGLLCAPTLGIGCILSIIGGVIAASCAAGIGDVCGEQPDTSAAAMVEYMVKIKYQLDDMSAQMEIGRFEGMYNTYMDTIRMAVDRYDRDIILRSSKPGKEGIIVENYYVTTWMNDILADGQYNVRGALDMIEDMIEGRPGLSRTPSVYELASDNGFCSPKLFDFVASMVTGGTTMAFIALHMKGIKTDYIDENVFRDRLQLNADMFSQHCPGKREFCQRDGKTIPQYARSEAQDAYSSLTAAKEECNRISTVCGGITYSPKKSFYSLRRGPAIVDSTTAGAVSFERCWERIPYTIDTCRHWQDYNCDILSGCSFGCTRGNCWKMCQNCVSSSHWCYQSRRCNTASDCIQTEDCQLMCHRG